MTQQERLNVQRLLHQLAERRGGWDELMDAAGIPRSTTPPWRYEPRHEDAEDKPTTPQAVHLLRILRAAGVLTEDYLLAGEPPPGLSEEERAVWTERNATAAEQGSQGRKGQP